MPAVTRSFSGPAELIEASHQRAEALGYERYSDYIKALIKADLGIAQPRPIAATLHEDPPTWKTTKPTKKAPPKADGTRARRQ